MIHLKLDGYSLSSDLTESAAGTCSKCIYWSQGQVCLAHYCNLVFGTLESPNAGKEVDARDSCRTWYEGEGLDLDVGYDETDPWRPMEVTR